MPLVAVLASPVFVGIVSEWLIERRVLSRTVGPPRRGAATVPSVVALAGVVILPLVLVHAGEVRTGPTPSVVPVVATPTDLPVSCLEPRGTDIDACERAWMFGHASASLPGPSVVLLLLVCCYWWVAVELTAWWRARVGTGGAGSTSQ